MGRGLAGARFFFVFCLVTAAVARSAAAGAAPSGGLLWPLQIAPALSSTFGETRAAGFHTGVDVKTWGRTGYPVRAAGDGWVSRLRTSPWGYGRAVYLQLAEGRTVVYGHLEGFAPGLARTVEAAQRRQGSYTVDLWPGQGELPVRRGEVIAYSGQSGAGPPHLHLEVRDTSNAPLNPLLQGYRVADSAAPLLQAVAFVPRGLHGWVDGGHDPVLVPLHRDPHSGDYAGEAVPVLSGPVGVGLLAYDRADAADNPLAPLGTCLVVDGLPVFSATYARFSYGDNGLVALDRLRLPFQSGESPYFCLYRRPGNRLPFYEGEGLLLCGAKGAVPGGGTAQAGAAHGPWPTGIALAPGLHGLEVQAVDAAGNRSRAPLRIRVGASSPEEPGEPTPPAVVPVALVGPGLQLVAHHHAGFCELEIRSSQPLLASPSVRAGEALRPVRQAHPGGFRADIPLDAAGPEALVVRAWAPGPQGEDAAVQLTLSQRQVRPGQGARLSFGAGAADLVFAPGSAYEPFFPQGETYAAQAGGELSVAGAAFAFGPHATPFDERIEVWLACAAGTPVERLGVYADAGEGRWVFMGNQVDAARRMVGARTRQLGRLAVLADQSAPQMDGLLPPPGARLAEPRPLLAAHVVDRGSGIGREEDIRLLLDGTPVIGVYDPEADRVECLWRQALDPGPHELEVQVRDMSGNQASARSRFTVAPPAR
ncbi:MAG: M23 family metallopeptidase [Candidatus Latescibacterota bacterium]